MSQDTKICVRCRCNYNAVDVDTSGVCIDCREGGCCGTSKAPPGWFCTRPEHADGPCAAVPICEHERWTFTQPLEVRCPCWLQKMEPCPGILRADGRNVPDNRTFLICDSCACCFVASDVKR